MTGVEYLEKYRDATRELARVQEEYKQEMALIDNIRDPLSGDGMPRSGEISKKVEKDAIRLQEKAEELKLYEVHALAVRQEIVRTINRVSEPAADVLMERFVKLPANGRFKTWRAVADAVGYSEENVYALRKKGISEVEKMLFGYTFTDNCSK